MPRLLLDRDRELRFTWKSLRRLYGEHGINLLDVSSLGDSGLQRPDREALCLWAALLHDDPELTVEQVDALLEDLVERGQLQALDEALGQALLALYPAAQGAAPDPSTPSSAVGG